VAGAVVWSGRIATAVAPRTELEIVTAHGTGRARATERDVWGGTRVRGTGRPPFPVDVLDVTDPDDTHPDDTDPDVAALSR
jgi:hypothetical protein